MQHRRATAASMFQNGISRNTDCDIMLGFHKSSHNSSTLLRFENPSKQSTFNNMKLLGKIFRSIALMMHPVGATTNCEKNCDIIVHRSLNFL